MLPLFVTGHFAHHMLTALPTPLLPFIRENFNLDYTQAALVLTAFSLANGFSQLPGGWLADRINPRILILVGTSGLAIGAVLVGISHTYIMMLVFLIIMGVLAGGYHPAAAPLVSASVEPHQRGRALGVHNMGSSVAFFLLPIIAAAIAAAWGWRWSFIILAVPVAIFGLFLFRMLGKHTHAASRELNKHGYELGDAEHSPHRWRRLVVFLVLSILTGSMIHTAVSFVPLYLVDIGNVDIQIAASLISVHAAAGFFGAPIGGYLSDRLGKIPVVLVACVIGGICVYLFNISTGVVVTGVLLLVIGLVMYTRMPVSEAFILSHTTVRNRSTIYGIYYFATQETSALLAPLFGWLIQRYSFSFAFSSIGSIVVISTLISSVFLWSSRERPGLKAA